MRIYEKLILRTKTFTQLLPNQLLTNAYLTQYFKQTHLTPSPEAPLTLKTIPIPP